MSFEVYPVLDPGDRPSEGIWYSIAPESSTGLGNGRGGPCPRVGATASSYVNQSKYYSAVFVSAGATLDGPFSDLHQLQFSRGKIEWSCLPGEGLPARYEHASYIVASVDGRSHELRVFAGAKPECPVSDMWKYDLDGSSWEEVSVSGLIPTPRTFHSSSSVFDSGASAASSSGDLMVYSGGDRNTNPIPDQRLYMFNTSSSKWTSLETSGRPPSPRQGHVTAVVGHMIYVHGGMAGQTFLDDLNCLDLDTLEWFSPEVSGRPPPPLTAHGAAILDTRIFVFGGWSPDETEPTAQDTLYCLHTETLRWEKVVITGAPPPARMDFAMCGIELPVSHLLSPSATCTASPGNESEYDNAPGIVSGTGRGDLEGNQGSPQACLADDQDLFDRKGDGRDEGGKKGESTSTDPEASPSPIDSEASSFRTVTIIDPEKGSPKSVGGPTTQILCKQGRGSPKNNIGTCPCEGVDFELVSALFVFGGMDCSGHVHGDSFIFVPS